MPRSFAKDDLPILRGAIIFCVVSLLLSVAAVTGSGLFASARQNAKAQAQAIRDEARTRANLTETEQHEIHDFQPKFRQLRESGFVGEERRLDWVDYLNDIQRRRGLEPISYEIAAQQTFDVDPSVLSGDLKLHGSQITVTLKLLHEMDLFNFLADLKKDVLYVPQSCEITRLRVPPNEPLAPNVSAQCTLYWLTMSAAPVSDAPTQ